MATTKPVAAVYANRTRLGSGVGKQAMRRRAEIVERSFAHNLDRGGMRRTWLRGRVNVHKRYLGSERYFSKGLLGVVAPRPRALPLPPRGHFGIWDRGLSSLADRRPADR